MSLDRYVIVSHLLLGSPIVVPSLVSLTPTYTLTYGTYVTVYLGATPIVRSPLALCCDRYL